MGDELGLPGLAIERIQSFLSSEEAARTTVLSKSWRGAWLTRPNLDFDEKDFAYETDPFLEFAEETLERCEASNLRIQSFSLRMKSFRSNCPARISNLILRALQLEPTRLAVSVDSSWCFVLPNEVFESESLVELTVQWCRIELGPDPKVACSRLRSLCLEHVFIKNRDMFLLIVSSCPLIEKLSLRLVIHSNSGDGVSPIITLRRLRSLRLKHVDSRALFLGELSAKFPSLKDLTVCMSIGDAKEDVLISSPSLERLDVTINRFMFGSVSQQRVKVDVPSIRKLTFEASTDTPSLTLGYSSSLGWESDHASVMHRRKCLAANSIDFLGEGLLQGVDVRISNLSQLMYGLNDLEVVRAQIFDAAASMWRDVPLLDDSAIPQDRRNVRFQMIWQPKQKLN